MDYIRNLTMYPTSLWTRILGETPERPAQQSRLINLPAELLLQILGYLELHDDLALSRTFSDLRVLTGRDWQSLVANRLSPARRVTFGCGSRWRCRETRRTGSASLVGDSIGSIGYWKH
ncbi:hypothetical protein C8035_v004465 [Colletotrichum spinosum]|uniref:F-box domain-containing protein n=1 Tax=Colletotrichum spinosum TaxID=1347390 RepID=A0A4R8PZ59_9PEZI|nr:hypothetical protein C8035_v004465 [Colletotrichum spinosum]